MPALSLPGLGLGKFVAQPIESLDPGKGLFPEIMAVPLLVVVVLLGRWLRQHRAVVFDGHKLIEKERGDSSEHLMYDLGRDPAELRNLFGRPEARDIQRTLLGWLRRLTAEVDAYEPR